MTLSQIKWPLVVLLLAGAGTAALILIKKQPPRSETKPIRVLVEVMQALPGSRQVTVRAMGTVEPVREITLQAEVSGRAVEVNPRLAPGARFHRGEVMARIDRRDYENAFEQARARLEAARLSVKLEEGSGVVARREWELFDDDVKSTTAGRALALREPQQQNAFAALEAAASALKQAQINLERTVIRAPFDAMVVTESIDVGAQVTPQTPLAHLVGTRAYRVRVSVSVRELQWIRFPENEKTMGSPVRVLHDAGGSVIEKAGAVERLFPDVDAVGRMARVLVRVPDPLGIYGGETGALPLLLGAYVRVEIEGRTLANVIALPRAALRDDDTVWIMEPSKQLAIRPVKVIWGDTGTVLVRDGIQSGEWIVTSDIPTPVPGIALRRFGEAEAEPVGAPETKPGVVESNTANGATKINTKTNANAKNAKSAKPGGMTQ